MGGGFSWGGVEGWGENADNGNWITINYFFKKERIKDVPSSKECDTREKHVSVQRNKNKLKY